MKILAKSIVSTSDMIKNYRSCRDKAKKLGKVFVFKNNQPDTVLFSFSEYEKFLVLFDYFEEYNAEDLKSITESYLSNKTMNERVISKKVD
ncbi:MAG: hypothetical protein Q8S24_02080 [Eubacteriales bacterium]|nr:hypothetical protein [Eubacteriales bacterium]